MCKVSALWPSDEVKTAFGIGIMFIQFFIPFMVLIICYGKIVWVLTRRINTDLIRDKPTVGNSKKVDDKKGKANSATQATDTGKDKFQLARRNTIKTLLIVGCCFIICWSQNQIIYFMYNCDYDLNFNSTYFQFTIIMVFLNCTVNPFIYLIKYRDYQEALRKLFCCALEQQSNNSLNSSTMSISSPTRSTRTY